MIIRPPSFAAFFQKRVFYIFLCFFFQSLHISWCQTVSSASEGDCVTICIHTCMSIYTFQRANIQHLHTNDENGVPHSGIIRWRPFLLHPPGVFFFFTVTVLNRRTRNFYLRVRTREHTHRFSGSWIARGDVAFVRAFSVSTSIVCWRVLEQHDRFMGTRSSKCSQQELSWSDNWSTACKHGGVAVYAVLYSVHSILSFVPYSLLNEPFKTSVMSSPLLSFFLHACLHSFSLPFFLYVAFWA